MICYFISMIIPKIHFNNTKLIVEKLKILKINQYIILMNGTSFYLNQIFHILALLKSIEF